METVYLLKIEGIMGGEGPHHRWSVMRPALRMGQNLSGYLNGPQRPDRSMTVSNALVWTGICLIGIKLWEEK